tara:strand:- start:78 stop:968 length:891 start_codon:yes stop_codon:yes gene_type:complete
MKFTNCEICYHNNWVSIYNGKIRDGIFGNYITGEVKKCNKCKAQRLAEKNCLNISSYQNSEYREKLSKGIDVSSFFMEQDIQTLFTLNTLWPRSVRDKTVMDIGAGAGSLLDSLKGMTKAQLVIEPYKNYHQSLIKRGYNVFSCINDAIDTWLDKIDVAFAIQVIEHTLNPRVFLEEIKPFLKKNGILIISTPNTDDILLDILPDDYPSFFYRVVHRWYFNSLSLAFCAEASGFKVEQIVPLHRYSMSNMMNWLKNKKPMGNNEISGIDKSADDLWKTYLEKNVKSDCLYLILSKQ